MILLMTQQDSLSFTAVLKKYVLPALLVANLMVWVAVYDKRPGSVMSVYFLDVGQGDAILIDSPSHGRVLIDGGRNRKVLSELGNVLPFSDRRIDIVLATHPDADHIGGLPEVVSRYKVGLFLEPSVNAKNSINNVLHERLSAYGVESITARRGMVINFGDGAKLTILFPDQDVTRWDPNDASIVARLTYGDHSFLLTGDATLRTENILLNLDTSTLVVDVLKVGHHGSRTSTSLAFVQVVMPDYAIISAGKDNSYGHPHKDVLNNLAQVGARVLSTAESGTITLRTDGRVLKVR
jgi:competence protein ComEC